MTPSIRTTRAEGAVALALIALALHASLGADSAVDAAEPLRADSFHLEPCELTFEPDEVPIQGEPTTVVAEFSESIEPVEEIGVPTGSGLEVLSHAPDPNNEGRHRIVISTEAAQVGDWTVTVSGADATCAGTIRAVQGESPEPEPEVPPTDPVPEPEPEVPPTDPFPLPDSGPEPEPDLTGGVA